MTSPVSPSYHKSNIGPIVGGAVGGAVAVLIAILVLYCLHRKRSTADHEKQPGPEVRPRPTHANEKAQVQQSDLPAPTSPSVMSDVTLTKEEPHAGFVVPVLPNGARPAAAGYTPRHGAMSAILMQDRPLSASHTEVDMPLEVPPMYAEGGSFGYAPAREVSSTASFRQMSDS